MAQVARPQPLQVHEIIDVDLLDDDELAAATNFRRQRRRLSPDIQSHSNAGPSEAQEPIIILDSDDEVDIVSPPSVSPSRRRRGQGLRSPPPAPRPVSPIPPVPSLRARRPFPRTRNHTNRFQQAPPVIIPNEDPFAFEANLEVPRRNPSPPPPPIPPPRAAAPSHHQPSMGLGGAFLALARQDAAEDRRRQQQQPANRSRVWGNITGLLANALGLGTNPRDLLNIEPLYPRLIPGEVNWPEWPFGNIDPNPLDFYHLDRPPKTTEAMWKASWTHPGKRRSGFSSDFASHDFASTSASGTSTPDAIIILDDDEEGLVGGTSFGTAAPSQTTSALVCARCMQPLVLDSGGSSAITEEEKKLFRVWGLRCGHMLDGRCIHTLMRPSIASVVTGKRKAGEIHVAVGPTADVATPGKGKGRASRDVKGKGKAVPIDDDHFTHLVSDAMAEPDSSIRSRLRSRHTQPSATDSRPTRPLPSRGSATTKVKGKGRSRKPTLLGDYEWMCPVTGCGRIHRSVKMSDADETLLDGWSMDAERGAIALFV